MNLLSGVIIYLSQLDLNEDDVERPPLLHVHRLRPAKAVEQHHSPKSKMKLILKEWSLEIAMSALSIMLFTVIVILLKHYDKQPTSSWSFYQLNVNSMVAILSTLLRSFLFMILEQGLLTITAPDILGS